MNDFAFLARWQLWLHFVGVIFGTTSLAQTPSAPITAIAWSEDQKSLVVGSQQGIEIRSPDGLAVVERLPTKLEHVHDLKFSPDGRSILVAGGSPSEFGSIEVWDWPSRTRIRTVVGHDDVVHRIAWSPQGKWWASAGWDGVCHVFDSDSGNLVSTFAGHSRPVLAIDFLADGETILSAGSDHTIQVWQANTGTLIRTLSNHVNTVNDVAIAPQQSAIALQTLVSVSDDFTVRLWQPTIGRLVRFAKVESRPKSVAWHSGGMRFIVGCEDGTVRQFDAATLTEQKKDQASQGAVISLARSPLTHELTMGSDSGQIKRVSIFERPVVEMEKNANRRRDEAKRYRIDPDRAGN